MRARRTALLIVAAGFAGWIATSLRAGVPTPGEEIRVGKELFAREWAVNDPRSRGGDGLGPVYNANSCVACHSSGGVGGSGPREKNAVIVSASVRLNPKELIEDVPRKELEAEHPAFRTSRAVVLHREGAGENYAEWRKDFLRSRHGRFDIVPTERNTPALFGLGKIDAIPDLVIVRQARRVDPAFPEIQGRVARDSRGRVGKFGWKAQTASLGQFVRTACAVELGLEVPGQHQSPDPRTFADKAPGLDLSDAECDALVAYVAALPTPIVRPPFDSAAARSAQSGRETFATIGCASCHVAKLGDVDGIYSDLLLHDMGATLRDASIYYGTDAPAPGAANLASTKAEPAEADEWRTPPLWGVRDSGPYLHDGRALTVEQAILAHGGSAAASTNRFATLDRESKRQVLAFLNSLSAPKTSDGPRVLSTLADRPGPSGGLSVGRLFGAK